MSVTLLYQILPWINRVMWTFAGLLCGLLAAHWFALSLENGSTMPPASAGVKAGGDPQRERLADYSIILERNLFGVPPSSLRDARERAPAQETAGSQRVTDIELLGTVAGIDTPFALIRIGGEQEMVRVGDPLPGGRELVEVRRSEIVVRLRDGSEAVVPLQEGMVSSEPTPTRPTRREPSKPASSYQVESVGENRWRIPREEAERARENVNALLKTARMTPNIVDGQTEGFVVVTVQPRSLLSKMGIRPRDILREINGVELDSPEKALQIFYQLREARTLTLALQRNGKPLTFDYVVE